MKKLEALFDKTFFTTLDIVNLFNYTLESAHVFCSRYAKNATSFFILPFQRAYAWGKPEIERFFNDTPLQINLIFNLDKRISLPKMMKK